MHLILTTRTCERIFLQFGTVDREIVDNEHSNRKLERLGLQSDFLITKRIVPGEWQINSILDRLPEKDHVLGNDKLSV